MTRTISASAFTYCEASSAGLEKCQSQCSFCRAEQGRPSSATWEEAMSKSVLYGNGARSERTNVPTAEAERQLGLAYDMLKSCGGTPFTVAERDQCQGHIREAFRMLRGDLAAAEATARAAEAAWRDAERYRVLREHGGDGCMKFNKGRGSWDLLTGEELDAALDTFPEPDGDWKSRADGGPA